MICERCSIILISLASYLNARIPLDLELHSRSKYHEFILHNNQSVWLLSFFEKIRFRILSLLSYNENK